MPGVEHHDVHAAPVRGDPRKSGGHGRGTGDIHRHADNAVRVAFPKFSDKLVELLAGQIGNGDMTAALEQSLADTVTDRPGRAGDNRQPSDQSRVVAGFGVRLTTWNMPPRRAGK